MDYELIEERLNWVYGKTRNRDDLFCCVMSFVVIELRKVLKSAFSKQTQVYSGSQGDQTLVRADI